MDEATAQQWIERQFGTEALERLHILANLVRDEATNQNLVSAQTLDQLWARHIVDSAQLLLLAQGVTGSWLDIGTGAGFPGLVVALLRPETTALVEPRKRRGEFLTQCIAAMGLENAHVHQLKVERMIGTFAVISARAVAALPRLLSAAEQCSTAATLWLLPKGQSAAEEVAAARATWHGSFHVEHSVTEPSSRIVVARGVRRR